MHHNILPPRYQEYIIFMCHASYCVMQLNRVNLAVKLIRWLSVCFTAAKKPYITTLGFTHILGSHLCEIKDALQHNSGVYSHTRVLGSHLCEIIEALHHNSGVYAHTRVTSVRNKRCLTTQLWSLLTY